MTIGSSALRPFVEGSRETIVYERGRQGFLLTQNDRAWPVGLARNPYDSLA